MLKTLVFVQIAAVFGTARSKKKKKKSAGRTLLTVAAILYLAGMLFMLLYETFSAMMPALAAANAQWLIFAISGIGATVLSLVCDVPMAQAQLYDSRDNDMLLAMPVPEWMILFSRMLAMYVISLVYSVGFYIPAFVVAARYVTLSLTDVLCALVTVLLAQLVPLALASILARFFVWLKKKYPKSQIITSVLLGFVLLAYMYLCGNLSNLTQQLTDNAAPIAEALRTKAVPFYLFGRACMGDLVSLGLVAVFSGGVFLLIYLRLTATFSRTAAAFAENKSSRKAGRKGAGQVKLRTPMGAFLHKELSHFTASSSYMLNAGFGLLITLAGAVMLLVRRQMLLSVLDTGMLDVETLAALMTAALCLLATMNLISAPSVSLERNRIWIPQSMPVAPSVPLLAKALCHFVICAPVSAAAGILMMLALRPGALSCLLMLLVPLCMNVFIALFGVRMNLAMPRLDYVNDVAALKSSGAVVITMFAGMAIATLPAVAWILLPVIPVQAALALYGGVLLLAAGLTLRALTHRAGERFSYLN